MVLSQGGVGKESSEETDEQVVLALEFLSFHTDSCKHTFLAISSCTDYGTLLTLRLKVLIHVFLVENY